MIEGQRLIARGSAVDPQDGALPGVRLAWSLDGRALGGGMQTEFVAPSPGTHELTLTARNTANIYGSVSVRLDVKRATSGPPSVEIEEPLDATHLNNLARENPVTLRASASDPEDGSLDGGSVRWLDTYPGPDAPAPENGVRDALLGTGAILNTGLRWREVDEAGPIETQHRVTVVATDADGQTARDTITVYTGVPVN